jgi:hypothetical protein
MKMTLQQFLNDYHLDTDGDYDERYEHAQCFVCDAQEHPDIIESIESIYAFAGLAFNVRLR